jgi:hypothetical protein
VNAISTDGSSRDKSQAANISEKIIKKKTWGYQERIPFLKWSLTSHKQICLASNKHKGEKNARLFKKKRLILADSFIGPTEKATFNCNRYKE